MKIEKQIALLNPKLDLLIEKYIGQISELKLKIRKLTESLSKFDRNWVGEWASETYNYYNDFTTSNNRTVVFDEHGILEYIESESGVTIKEIKDKVPDISKAHRDFKDIVVTELSVIKGIDKLNPEIDLLNRLETYKWGISPLDYIKMKRPQSFVTRDPASILNKGLDTPPHLIIGGELMSLFTTLSSIEGFQRSVKRLIRQLELKFSIEESTSDKVDFIVKILNSFHNVAIQLRNRYNKRDTLLIKDEYDVQDLLHGLLRIEFEDIRPEEYTPSYAGSASRMDFLLKKEKTIIEVKKTREGLKDKEVADQLILDAQHYKAHPDCRRLICFVYDPENRIRNPKGLENDLNRMTTDDFIMEVYIRP